jgi:hypothetical protein
MIAENKYRKDLLDIFGQVDLMISEIASMEDKIKEGSKIDQFSDMQFENYPENPRTTLKLALQKARLTLKMIEQEVVSEVKVTPLIPEQRYEVE